MGHLFKCNNKNHLQNFSSAALIIDGISIKEHITYDRQLGRAFGFVDYGGNTDMGEKECKAKEALVCLLVGFRKYWKIPIAYFLLQGTKSGFLAGVIRECISRAYTAGIQVCRMSTGSINVYVERCLEKGDFTAEQPQSRSPSSTSDEERPQEEESLGHSLRVKS